MKNQLNPNIAIVDSGIGGISILKQLISRYNSGNYIYFADNLYMPYGNKKSKWLKNRIENIIKLLKEKYKVDYVIIACNTASSVILNNSFDNVTLMKFTDNITYFATDLTKKNLTNNRVISDKNLASKIENNIFETQKIEKIIKQCVQKHKLFKFDKLVLGCTHYELVSDIFKKFCPNTQILNNSSFLLENLHLNIISKELNLSIIVTNSSEKYRNKIFRMIKPTISSCLK